MRPLRFVKLVHTAVWAFFAGCIVAIPILAARQQIQAAVVLIAVVSVEVLVLVGNGFVCPLTDVAARYTSDRRANFDIYLPLWLARHNQRVFGTLFVLGILATVAAWLLGW